MRSAYLAVLRLPHARPLLLASVVGRLSNATGPLSVVLLVQEETGSLAQAGVASATIRTIRASTVSAPTARATSATVASRCTSTRCWARRKWS